MKLKKHWRWFFVLFFTSIIFMLADDSIDDLIPSTVHYKSRHLMFSILLLAHSHIKCGIISRTLLFLFLLRQANSFRQSFYSHTSGKKRKRKIGELITEVNQIKLWIAFIEELILLLTFPVRPLITFSCCRTCKWRPF